MREAELAENGLNVGGGAVNDVKARVFEAILHDLHELIIDLEDDQRCVGTHPLEDVPADGADAGAKFDDYLRTIPIDVAKKLIHEEAGARNERTEHAWILEKVSGEDEGWTLGLLNAFEHSWLPPIGTT